MNGYNAYKTYNALKLHFMRKGYDGWKYNFRNRVPSYEDFRRQGQSFFVFQKIEKENPTLKDQLRFFYPKFKIDGPYQNHIDYRLFDTFRRNFQFNLGEKFDSEIELLAQMSRDYKMNIMKCDNDLPNLYLLTERGNFSNETVILLFLLIPQLNRIVSKERFIFDQWKSEILFNVPFYNLFVTETLKNSFLDSVSRHFKI
jgi:hypothetical protein